MPLDHTMPVMRAYHQAKHLHWDPRDLNLTQDRLDWQRLTATEKDGVLQLTSLFLAGEEAVTHDLAPLLIGLRRRGGHLADEMFLAVQLYEEAKHFEFFDRWLSDVVGQPVDFASYRTPSYDTLFYEELPRRLARCLEEQSPLTLALASSCYHILIEGVMAETGYYSFARSIRAAGVLPGLLQGVQLVQRDEARHIFFGLSLIASLIAAEPAIWPEIVESLNSGVLLCTAALAEAFERYDGGEIPFGLDLNDTVDFAVRQFGKRYGALERIAAGQIGRDDWALDAETW